MKPILSDRPVLRAVLLFLIWMLFGFALIQALTVTVAWWRSGFNAVGPWEGLWIVLLPVLILVYIRYFSIFRSDCKSCQPDDKGDHSPRIPGP